MEGFFLFPSGFKMVFLRVFFAAACVERGLLHTLLLVYNVHDLRLMLYL